VARLGPLTNLGPWMLILLNQVCSSFEESKSLKFDGRLDVFAVRMDDFKLEGGRVNCLKRVFANF